MPPILFGHNTGHHPHDGITNGSDDSSLLSPKSEMPIFYEPPLRGSTYDRERRRRQQPLPTRRIVGNSSRVALVFFLVVVSCFSTKMSQAWVLPAPSTTTTAPASTGILKRHQQPFQPRSRSVNSIGRSHGGGTCSASLPPRMSPSALFMAFRNPYQNSSLVASAWVVDEAMLEKDQAALLQLEQGIAAAATSTTVLSSFSPPSAAISVSPTVPPHEDGLYKKRDDVSTAASVTDTSSTACSSIASFEEEREMAVPVPADTHQQQAMLWARILLIGAAALYGTSFSLVKLMGESDIPVGVSSTIRFGMAAVVTSPWLLAPPAASSTKESSSKDAWAAAKLGFEVGLWNSVGYVSQAVGLETTPASVSAFLCALAVVVVPFLDMWSGKRLQGRQWTGALLALAGVALLELGHGFTGTWTTGDMASMLQPFAFGLGFSRLEDAMHKYPSEGKRSTAAQIMAVFLGCVLYTVVTEHIDFPQVLSYLSDPTTVVLFFWTGVIATALSVYMESVALKTLTAAETTLLLSTEPLWGALWASLLVGEHLGFDTLSGGLMILAGCLYSSLGWTKLKHLAMGKRIGGTSAAMTTTTTTTTTTCSEKFAFLEDSNQV